MGTTHYSYIAGPAHFRQVTSTLDLSCASLETRRDVIHALLDRGELLAAIPSYFQGQDDIEPNRITKFLDGVLD